MSTHVPKRIPTVCTFAEAASSVDAVDDTLVTPPDMQRAVTAVFSRFNTQFPKLRAVNIQLLYDDPTEPGEMRWFQHAAAVEPLAERPAQLMQLFASYLLHDARNHALRLWKPANLDC